MFGYAAQRRSQEIGSKFSTKIFVGKGERSTILSCLPPSLPPSLCQNKLMHFPTWVDLKGLDSVPETVHHVVCHVNPVTDTAWYNLGRIRVEVRPTQLLVYDVIVM